MATCPNPPNPSQPMPLPPRDGNSIAQFQGQIYRVTNPTQISSQPSNIDVYRSLRSLVVSRDDSSGYPVIRKLS
ncbi:hypothetical protein POG22_05545 [Geitlerinema sp. CS-897]|nr:hypothetical protein [Geitlerinema sp. CS-897]